MIIDFSKYDCDKEFSVIITPGCGRRAALSSAGSTIILSNTNGENVTDIKFKNPEEALQVFTLIDLAFCLPTNELQKAYPEYFL